MVKLSEIKSLMIHKEPGRPTSKTQITNIDGYKKGFNQAIDLQGNKEIGLSREKLASMLSVMLEDDFNPVPSNRIYEIAITICAAEGQIIEVKNEETI